MFVAVFHNSPDNFSYRGSYLDGRTTWWLGNLFPLLAVPLHGAMVRCHGRVPLLGRVLWWGGG